MRKEKKLKQDRYELVYSQSSWPMQARILVDRETGVNYLFCQSGYAGGLTPLLDAEGKPVITPVAK